MADLFAASRSPAPSRLAGCAGVTVLALGLAATLVFALAGDRLDRWWAGETDLAGEPVYLPPHPVDAAALGRVDFARVHGELLPGYVIAASYVDSPEGLVQLENAAAALREGVAADRNLDAIVVELHELVRAGPARSADRLQYLSWAWNDYLGRNGVPWRIDASINLERDHGLFYAKCYRVLATVPVTVGDATYQGHLLTRADRLNVVELYLGQASRHEDGALVVVDRVAGFAFDDVWPLLDPALDPRQLPSRRAFAPAVRAEIGAALSPADVAVLTTTALDRAELASLVSVLHARRDCGSRFVIPELPWDGLPETEYERVRRFAVASEGRDCPDITAEEAEQLASLSTRLRTAPGLEPAVEALVAWISRGVLVHEARHVADDDQVGIENPLPCAPCGDAPVAVRAELSAYLASFATDGLAATSLYQACEVLDGGGSHAAALQLLLPELAPEACSAGPPADLTARARDLEMRWLGRSEPIVLSDKLPARVPLRSLSD